MRILVTLLLWLLPSAAAALTPEQDFAVRCAAPGVLKCVGFDNTTTDIVPKTNLQPDGYGAYRGSLDTAQKASGPGSLRFDLPPPPHSGANIAGSWMSTTPIFGQTFSEGSTFYVQYRVRFSPEVFANTWPANNSWKIAIIHQGGASCAALELTGINRYRTDVAAFYTHCGANSLYTNPATGLFTKTTPLLMQQGDYRCEYGKTSADTCFILKPDQWLTFYYKVSIGAWGQPNSTIDIYVHRQGETGYKQIIKMPNYTLTCNRAPCDVAPGKFTGFDNITLTPYMTGLPKDAGLPGVVSKVWYDELIVSTQPIAAPTLDKCY